MNQTTVNELIGLGAAGTDAGDVVVSGVVYRSDEVRPGDVFFCVPGFAHDGHDFASDAAARGASALVVQRELAVDVPQVIVADTRAALARASASFFGDPSAEMPIIGITGTNGKTTTAYLVDSILRAAGHTTGLIGTVETRIAGERLPSARTTPESAELQRLFRTMLEQGVTACTMEVSSHAIDLRRVDDVHLAVAAFTNLTQDHLDYHHTLEEYFSVKRRLFTEFDVKTPVVNIDDKFGAQIAALRDDALTVGRVAGADVTAIDETLTPDGTTFVLRAPIGDAIVRIPLAGAYNVSNALVAAGSALALGIDLATVVSGLRDAPQVPGRLERIDCGQPYSVIVDYAHTPDSLEQAIAAVRGFTRGRVVTVFGCGGDRDPDKRPMMGLAAARASDHVVVTSDNPRSEDPVGIILQIEDGLRGGSATYDVVVDRRDAIEHAIRMAKPGDTVFVAGKGHEDYQIFADRTIHFDDREVAREVIGSC